MRSYSTRSGYVIRNATQLKYTINKINRLTNVARQYTLEMGKMLNTVKSDMIYHNLKNYWCKSQTSIDLSQKSAAQVNHKFLFCVQTSNTRTAKLWLKYTWDLVMSYYSLEMFWKNKMAITSITLNWTGLGERERERERETDRTCTY
jgi:hypothetical protein